MRAMCAVIVVAACGSPAAPAAKPAAVAPRAVEVPLSEPAEYEIDRVSAQAGEAIFTRTGIGDPYKTGIPYPIFLALQGAFPETFGRDTTELASKYGFIARAADLASDDADVRAGLPVGMHLTTDPFTSVPFVVTNCSLCHAERLHWPGGEATVIGLGNKRVRIHAYDAAFAEVTTKPGFSADKLGRLAREQAKARDIAWPDAYADAFVGATIAALKTRASERAALHAKAAGGPPGRVAVIESFVLALAKLSGAPIDYAPDVGWSKVPDVIGFRDRVTLSWDASQEGPMDLLAVEADLANGVRIEWYERHPLQGASLGAYLRQPAARPAFPGKIDRALAARGKQLFEERCSDCHGTYGDDGRTRSYTESVVALADIGTDPARAHAPTESFARAANDPKLTRGYTKFRRTDGYVPPVLTNVWARAPYGHAGQWPSLAVLATPPAKRAPSFVVALDAPYDLGSVGVATHAPTGTLAAGEYLHDAAQPGFAVSGHPFLADLGGDARAVIEYLKTL
ncbi:MAG: hypothetical protein HOV81_21970 [Kofleriaceae bacterium]|nr:hypothetical protein [Kofleriaceae bacterium]